MLPLRHLALSLALFGTPAFSATLLVEDGILIGAEGVVVDGDHYNVSFQLGTCVDLYNGCDEQSDFTFSSMPSATLAFQALIDQVFIDSSAGNFDSDPSLTRGCENLDQQCDISTPYALYFDIGFSRPYYR